MLNPKPLAIRILLDIGLMLLPKRRRAEGIGIVRLDAIGDFIIWLPAAQALIEDRKASGQRIVLIANALWATWAEKLMQPDELIPIKIGLFGHNLKYRLTILWKIRRLGLQEIIVPTFSRIPGDGNDAVIFASGATRRIANMGYRSRNQIAGCLRKFLNKGYTQVISVPGFDQNGRQRTEPEINERFTHALGVTQQTKIAELPITMKDGLIGLKIPKMPYIVFIPGGSWAGKTWPIARFAEIAYKLKAKGVKIVVCGSADEFRLCEEVAAACNGINLAGHTTLPTLTEVIRGASLVIGNDSAGIHIAVAVRTDSICVMWGGSFGRFIPYRKELLPSNLQSRAVYRQMDCFGCTGNCRFPKVEGKVRCIEAITIADVLNTALEILRLN